MIRLVEKFIVLCIFAITVSCSPVSNISVSNAGNSDALRSSSFLYALPQTVLDVYAEAQEVTIIPGPYAIYARKYLGIQHVTMKEEHSFYITKINLSRHLEADPDFIFSVNGVSDYTQIPGLNNLIKDSLILPAQHFSADQVSIFSFPYNGEPVLFTDLSVKRNFEAEKDVDVSMVMPDTNYATAPKTRMVLKEKTPEQKAEEAANFLIKLKKRRFKLVAGQYDYMPEGAAMGDALKELERIEAEYLSLFIGKRTVTTLSRVYHYAPESGKNQQQIVLFRFSKDAGFIETRESAGIPVMLEIKQAGKIKELVNAQLPLKPAANTVPYRVPDQVSLRLLAGEQIWAEAIFPVFQFGVPLIMDVQK